MGMFLDYTKTNVFNVGLAAGGVRRFMPGVNEISPDEWDEISKNPLVAARFKNGDMRWLPGKGPESVGKNGSASLKGMNQKAAVEIVEKTLDFATLEGWLASENRPTVMNAIKKQLDVVIPKGEDRDGGEDKGFKPGS